MLSECSTVKQHKGNSTVVGCVSSIVQAGGVTGETKGVAMLVGMACKKLPLRDRE